MLIVKWGGGQRLSRDCFSFSYQSFEAIVSLQGERDLHMDITVAIIAEL